MTSLPASWTSQSNSTPLASSTRRVASASSGPVPSPGMKVTRWVNGPLSRWSAAHYYRGPELRSGGRLGGRGTMRHEEVAPAHQDQGEDAPGERDHRGDDQDLVETVDEGPAGRDEERVADARPGTGEGWGAPGRDRLRHAVARPGRQRQRGKRLGQLVRHAGLEDGPERRDSGGRAHLPERAVDPRRHPAPARLDHPDRRAGERRVDEADADAAQDEAGQERRPVVR